MRPGPRLQWVCCAPSDGPRRRDSCGSSFVPIALCFASALLIIHRYFHAASTVVQIASVRREIRPALTSTLQRPSLSQHTQLILILFLPLTRLAPRKIVFSPSPPPRCHNIFAHCQFRLVTIQHVMNLHIQFLHPRRQLPAPRLARPKRHIIF